MHIIAQYVDAKNKSNLVYNQNCDFFNLFINFTWRKDWHLLDQTLRVLSLQIIFQEIVWFCRQIIKVLLDSYSVLPDLRKTPNWISPHEAGRGFQKLNLIIKDHAENKPKTDDLSMVQSSKLATLASIFAEVCKIWKKFPLVWCLTQSSSLKKILTCPPLTQMSEMSDGSFTFLIPKVSLCIHYYLEVFRSQCTGQIYHFLRYDSSWATLYLSDRDSVWIENSLKQFHLSRSLITPNRLWNCEINLCSAEEYRRWYLTIWVHVWNQSLQH